MKKLITFLCILSFFININNVFAEEKAKVAFGNCVDGDTAVFILNNDKIKVRFLAIDTPETKHPTKGVEPFGKEASNFTCYKITNAKEIILEFDKNSDKLDKYNRYLAWIFVDGNLLQSDLISKGYAKTAYLYDDYKYTNNLITLENKAKDKHIGIWSNYQDNDIESFLRNLDFKYKLLITIIIILIIIIYSFYDKKFRRKVFNKIRKNLIK